MAPPHLPAPDPHYKRPTMVLVDYALAVRLGIELPLHPQMPLPRSGETITFYQDGVSQLYEVKKVCHNYLNAPGGFEVLLAVERVS